jgi:predicted nucleic acid-binding Zn ribbon protein
MYNEPTEAQQIFAEIANNEHLILTKEQKKQRMKVLKDARRYVWENVCLNNKDEDNDLYVREVQRIEKAMRLFDPRVALYFNYPGEIKKPISKGQEIVESGESWIISPEKFVNIISQERKLERIKIFKFLLFFILVIAVGIATVWFINHF